MFGPAFLVNPVTAAGVTRRPVYLPAGTWYDFWTGATSDGGGSIDVDAPLSQLPLFVRSGSIVPMGPQIQHANESVDPLEIRVYPGADGSFVLYEDEGDTYAYEQGASAEIRFTWSEATQDLTISAPSGTFDGMLGARTFNVVWVDSGHGGGGEVSAPDRVIDYAGAEVVVSRD
jgi:alpha-D-xyloside xylohydrolase